MNYARQTEIFDPDAFAWPVHCIGLGGIGSAAAPTLAKLGVREFTLWDGDLVEDANVPNQFCYRTTDVGRPKVEAAAEVLRTYGATSVHAHHRRFTAGDGAALEGVVVSGVDSMESREVIWRAVRSRPTVPLYLDGRIGGEFLELLTVRPSDPGDVEWYGATLFPDAEAAPLPCGARAIIHPAVILAGLVAGQLTRWARRERWYRRLRYGCAGAMFVAECPVVPAPRAA